MDNLMKSLPLSILQLPTLIVTNANLHSHLWNPDTYGIHDTAADALVESMTQWDMTLRSPKGVITFESNSDKHPGTTIDLVWANQQADDLIVACMVDEDDVFNHHSDHRAMVTVIKKKFGAAPSPDASTAPKRNWHKLEHAKFLSELKALLPSLSTISSHTDIDILDNRLLTAITTSLNASSPIKSRFFKHKSWWNPVVLSPLRQAAARARRRAKTHPTDENRALYCSARNLYFKTIKKEKTNSWRRYLSTLTVDMLFQAKKYASGSKPSTLITTLIDKNGQALVSNEEKASALFNATWIATSECDLSDTPARVFPRHPDHDATYLPPPSLSSTKSFIHESIKDSHPMKAPGPDGIQNWVWVLAWDAIKNHVFVLFNAITTLGYIPLRWKEAKTVMLAKPGKSDYTQPGAYRPIALLNTLSKVYEKSLARYMSQLAESLNILHPGHYGARPGRSSQEALIHFVSWTKAHWRAGRVVGAIFADVKSAFPSVHHPRLPHTLECQQFHPELINVLNSFLSERHTFLSFNGFQSERFKLSHGLPQGSPLSPLLYLLYNNSLLSIPETHTLSTSLGFVDDVILMTAALNTHELQPKVQKLANEQIHWAEKHGAIFDASKSKWMIFAPSHIEDTNQAIDFGSRKGLQPVQETKWLGVTLDCQLKFKKHRDDVIAKGKKRANYLSSLSNTRWGIPTKLFKILIMSTVHAATDYAAAAWMSLPIPKFYVEKLATIDAICATKLPSCFSPARS